MKAKIQVIRERTGKLVCSVIDRDGFLIRHCTFKEAAEIVVMDGCDTVELIIGQDHYTLVEPQDLSHERKVSALVNTIMELYHKQSVTAMFANLNELFGQAVATHKSESQSAEVIQGFFGRTA